MYNNSIKYFYDQRSSRPKSHMLGVALSTPTDMTKDCFMRTNQYRIYISMTFMPDITVRIPPMASAVNVILYRLL